jgi:hypothetical protein
MLRDTAVSIEPKRSLFRSEIVIEPLENAHDDAKDLSRFLFTIR